VEAAVAASGAKCYAFAFYLGGGVAQWLGRWSLAGGLSLIYACSIVDM